MRRLLPRGLRGQLLVLLLGALVLTHVASLLLFFDERRLAVRAALGEETAARAANVVRLLDATPAELHPAILRAAGSPSVRFALAPTPEVAADAAQPGRRLARRLARLLDEERTGEVRIAVRRRDDPDGLRRGPFARPDTGGAGYRRDDGRHRPHGPPPRFRPALYGLTLAIELADGSWLNVATSFHRPPLQWAWPTALSLLSMAAAIVVVVGLGVGRIARPMRALADAADRFGRGGEATPVAVRGPAEVRVVTDAFNTMQERLARFVGERTRMLAALGHDLRSPLTAMRLRAEMVDDDETRERLVASIAEMQAMVEATLAYARGVATDETPRKVDLAALVREVADDVRAAGGEVTVAAPAALALEVRPSALKRAVRNVVENAVRYGDGATVRLGATADNVEIRVADRGPGVPAAERARIFEPFVRLEESRSRETGGVGLGLAIARTNVRAHGGDIHLADRDGGGLEVVIGLPLRRRPAG